MLRDVQLSKWKFSHVIKNKTLFIYQTGLLQNSSSLSSDRKEIIEGREAKKWVLHEVLLSKIVGEG